MGVGGSDGNLMGMIIRVLLSGLEWRCELHGIAVGASGVKEC